jgi:hypothetical protein
MDRMELVVLYTDAKHKSNILRLFGGWSIGTGKEYCMYCDEFAQGIAEQRSRGTPAGW